MAFIAVLITVVSCEKPTKTPVSQPSVIKVSPAEPAEVPEGGGTLTLNLASKKDWKVQDVPSWISVSPDSDAGAYTPQSISVTVLPNQGDAREAILKFVTEK